MTATETAMWPLPARLRAARVHVRLEARDLLELPPHKGGLLRGLIGVKLKRLGCAQRDQGACPPCAMGNGCAYGYLFEPRLPPGLPAGSDLSDPPAPFVVEPPEETRLLYRAGESLDLGLVLIGRGIQYLPYMLMALEELGSEGIGRRRARFHLAEVQSEGAPGGLGADELSALAAGWPADELSLRYLTPARLRHRMQYASRPEFSILVAALERRIAALALAHAEEVWSLDPAALAAAEQVQIVAARTDWAVRDRYAPRQQQGMSLSGVVGKVAYSGDLGPFRALLAMGELVHVGKAAVFGNGRYTVEPAAQISDILP